MRHDVAETNSVEFSPRSLLYLELPPLLRRAQLNVQLQRLSKVLSHVDQQLQRNLSPARSFVSVWFSKERLWFRLSPPDLRGPTLPIE